MSVQFSINTITITLTNLDFLHLSIYTAPNGTIWHAFAVGDGDSWWHDEPICWEVFVAEIPDTHPLFYIHGTLLPGVLVRTEREWAETLVRLVPDGEGLTRMEEVD